MKEINDLNTALEIAKRYNLPTKEIEKALVNIKKGFKTKSSNDINEIINSFDSYLWPWKPFNQLTVEIERSSNLLYWTEFIAGSEARKCQLMYFEKNPYIVVDAIFVLNPEPGNRIPQSVVCWAYENDVSDRKKLPYIYEEHQTLIRKLMRYRCLLDTGHRVISMKG